jgi:hypothetical protein
MFNTVVFAKVIAAFCIFFFIWFVALIAPNEELTKEQRKSAGLILITVPIIFAIAMGFIYGQ